MNILFTQSQLENLKINLQKKNIMNSIKSIRFL